MSFLKPINYGDTDTGLKTPSSLSRRSDKSITIIIIILHVNADQKRRTSILRRFFVHNMNSQIEFLVNLNRA